MTEDGNLLKMYNYDAEQFEINDIVGNFEKDKDGDI